jgi:hypothetical protein
VPIKKVAEMVDECAVCQKFRLGLRDQLTPISRVLKPGHHRSTVGLDTLTMTPKSEEGYCAIVTMVNHHTHFVHLYPVKAYDAIGVANAMMSYVGYFGLFDELASDPGSDLMSEAVRELNAWLGLRHKVSLVDVHTSNGCENTNKMIITHLSALVNDLRMKERWSDPKVLSLIQFHFNSSLSSEAGVEPFKATFGNADEIYYRLDPKLAVKDSQSGYVRELDESLKLIRQLSKEHQEEIKKKRVNEALKPNQFAIGDLVLKSVRSPTKHWKPQKLGPAFTGPWVVKHVNVNDYTCEHIIQGTRGCFHVSMIKPYFGSEDMARKAALLDFDQYETVAIHNYVGEPTSRRTLEFQVEYADGDILWKTWDEDLFNCEAYLTFCRTRPEMWSCALTVEVARKERMALNRAPIQNLSTGDELYVDLRALGAMWYNGYGDKSLDTTLPDEDTSMYVVPFLTGDFINGGRKVKMLCERLELELIWNADMCKCWGQYRQLESHMTLVDGAFLERYPQVMKSLREIATGRAARRTATRT